MTEKEIAVKVRVEGSYPPGYETVNLPAAATLETLLQELKKSGHRFSVYLFAPKTGEPAVGLALVNDVSVNWVNFKKTTLVDGDKVFFILPVSGG